MPDEKKKPAYSFRISSESTTENFRLLTDVYGDDVMSRPRVFELFNKIK